MMRRWISFCSLFILFLIGINTLGYSAGPVAGGRKAGLGLQLGSPTGVSFDYWLNHQSSLDFKVGTDFDDDATFILDYLYHDFSALRHTGLNGAGKTTFNIGGGVRFRTEDDESFGVRGVVGLSHFFSNSPFEIYGELAPVLILVDDVSGKLDAGVGFHYLF